MQNPGEYKITGFQYLQRFHCLAGECPDTCCRHWQIRLDQQDHIRLYDLITGTEGASRIQPPVTIPLQGKQGRWVSHLRQDDTGACHFLQPNLLCNLQWSHGIDALPKTCANYPRVLHHDGHRLHISGALSCPQITRLCLTLETGYTPVELDRQSLPPQLLSQIENTPPESNDNYYQRHADQVRKLLHELLCNRHQCLNQRLAICLLFAKSIEPFYYRSSQHRDTGPLEQALREIRLPELQQSIIDKISLTLEQKSLMIVVSQAILRLRAAKCPDENLSQLIQRIFRHYESHIPARLRNKNMELLSPEHLYRAYLVYKQIIDESVGEQIEEHFTRLCLNTLEREHFCGYHTLYDYLQMMVVRLSLVKFLFYSDPDFIKQFQQGGDQGEVAQEHAIRINTLLFRYLGHDQEFQRAIFMSVQSEQLNELGNVLAMVYG